jgi:hypothetical protein
LIENQLIPDIVIQLNAESGDLLKRILPKRMEQWAKKIQTRKDKRMKNKAKKDRDKVGNIILKLTLLIMISFLEKSYEGTSS